MARLIRSTISTSVDSPTGRTRQMPSTISRESRKLIGLRMTDVKSSSQRLHDISARQRATADAASAICRALGSEASARRYDQSTSSFRYDGGKVATSTIVTQ